MESLVIVDQHATVNTYLSLVLPARHTLEALCSGSVPMGGLPHGTGDRYHPRNTPLEAPDRLEQLE